MNESLIQKVSKGKKTVIYYENATGAIVSKECTKCNEIKGLGEFTKCTGKLADKRSVCKKCEALYRESVRSRKRETEIAYRVANKDRIREVERKYRETHREGSKMRCRKYYQRHREEILGRQKMYYLSNKSLFINKTMRYRSRLSNVPHELDSKDFDDIVLAFDGKCALTGEEDFEMDHVIPISTGLVGTVKGNLIPLSQKLNRSKKDKNLFEWFYENKDRLNIDANKFESLVLWLAFENEMTPDEYKKHVYNCHSKGGRTS